MKVLAIASGGGHWIELLRLQPAFEDHELVYMSTSERFAATVPGNEYHTIPDFSRWNKLKMLSIGWKIYRKIASIQPDLIVTTGAAPGVIALVIGKLLGAKTVWVESMCHAQKISLSGRLVKWFADRVYTQWEHLAGPKLVYAGNIMA
ncbi:MAG TPA: oligosaccharide biosynthesis protein Alg14 [Chitinophagaceae bacterium]